MRIVFIYSFSLVFFLLGCSKFSVEEVLPEIELLSPSDMESSLDRVNIIADQDSLDILFKYYLTDHHLNAEIQYYANTGDLLFNKDGFIEIKGAGSAEHPMKSLGITFNETINNSALQLIETSQALPGDDLSELRTVILRNSGNDYGVTQLKDLALNELAIQNSIDLELRYGKAVQVFVNDEYYGLLNLRTGNDRIAISNLLNVDVSAITTMKMDFPDDDIDFREGDEQVAEALISAIESEDGAQLNQLIDVDNFIDYILFEDYIGNTDWPHNNARLYSVKGGKFRFFLYDLDYAATRNKTQRLPKMEYLEDDISKMYQILRAYDHGFIQSLEEKQKQLFNTMSSQKFSLIVDELADNIQSEIGFFIQRRGAPFSRVEWIFNVENLKQDFSVNDHFNRKMYGFD